MVLNVNIVSPNKNHVRIGKTTKPVMDPINLEDQTESKPAVVNFQAYQNKTLVGKPKHTAEASGLSFHHSYRY